MIPTSSSREYIKRIMEERYTVDKDSGCWIWTGTKSAGGYPKISLRTLDGRPKQWYAHRVSYWYHNNNLPDDMHCCHKCDNPLCINPDHLFLGTDLDNHKDKVNKGRQTKGISHGGHKLTDDVIKKIKSGELKISRQLSLELLGHKDSSHLYAIKNGKLWKHLNIEETT